LHSVGTAVTLNGWPRGFVMVVVTDGWLNCDTDAEHTLLVRVA